MEIYDELYEIANNEFLKIEKELPDDLMLRNVIFIETIRFIDNYSFNFEKINQN
jgi:hypothetical protein